MKQRALALCIVAGLTTTGCATSYMAKGPGVSMAMKGGAKVYVRAGKTYRHGAFGGGLTKAVAGNTRAERAARSYHARTRNGFLLALPAALCSGIALHAATYPYESWREPALYTSLGCLVLMNIGLWISISGLPHEFDAINMYNDDLADARITMPGQPATAPAETLQQETPAAMP